KSVRSLAVLSHCHSSLRPRPRGWKPADIGSPPRLGTFAAELPKPDGVSPTAILSRQGRRRAREKTFAQTLSETSSARALRKRHFPGASPDEGYPGQSTSQIGATSSGELL